VPGSPFAASGNPDSVNVDASGHFLYARSGSSAPASGYAIDATTGVLTPLAVAAFNPSPGSGVNGALVFDNNSNRSFIVGLCEQNHGVSCGSAFLPYEYDLWTFAIDSQTGGLFQVGGPQYLFAMDEFSSLRTLSIDPSGKFLCVHVSESSPVPLLFDNLNCYAIDPTTGLSLGGYGSVSGAGPAGFAPPVWGTITIAR
jgi:6-phosphogluconolactonase (cycloisomerase 2 family)